MRSRKLAICLVLSLFLVCAAAIPNITTRISGSEEKNSAMGTDGKTTPDDIGRQTPDRIRALELLAQYDRGKAVDDAFLTWACENIAPDFDKRLADKLSKDGWQGEPFYELFGQTLHVLADSYSSGLQSAASSSHTNTLETVTLAFAGDVNLADDWENMQEFRARLGSVEAAISPPLLRRMKSADILMVNNEFSFSDRGAPLAGKQYTFRAATQNVSLFHELGVDIVSMANNHVFDYGPLAFLDTLDTLSGAGIPFVGAGRDLSEAMQARYFCQSGMKIAYIAAAHTQKCRFTPAASHESPGVLPCLDGTSLSEAVAEARERSDWVVVYLHWGTEYATNLEAQQMNLARELVDNGADIVVGAHPHVLQGLEFYKGKPIAYSLGNFWFNVGWVNSALLEVELLSPGEYRLYMQPCATAAGTVRLMENEWERRALFSHLERISTGIGIDDDGRVSPKA